MNGEELEAIAEEAIGDLGVRRAEWRRLKEGKRASVLASDKHSSGQYSKFEPTFGDESAPLNFRSTVRSG